MNKYIDAGKLIAEIERLRRVNIKDADNGCNIDQCDGYELCLTHIESFIQYLQQEQPEVDIEKILAEGIGEKWTKGPEEEKRSICNFARYFYELGLYAGKEE